MTVMAAEMEAREAKRRVCDGRYERLRESCCFPHCIRW